MSTLSDRDRAIARDIATRALRAERQARAAAVAAVPLPVEPSREEQIAADALRRHTPPASTAFLPALIAVKAATEERRAARRQALHGDLLADQDAEAATAGLDELEARLFQAVRGTEVACGYSLVEHVRGVARLIESAKDGRAAGRALTPGSLGYNAAERAS